MVQPPPPLPQAKEKRSVGPWVIGCAIGCGAIMMVGALFGMLAIFYAGQAYHKSIAKMQDRLPPELAKEYAKMKSDGLVPAEHEALFDAIFKVTQNKDTTPYAIILGGTVIHMCLDDGKVDKVELDAAQEVRTFLDKHPQPGLMETMEFVGSNPRLNKAFQKFQYDENIDMPDMPTSDKNQDTSANSSSDSTPAPDNSGGDAASAPSGPAQ